MAPLFKSLPPVVRLVLMFVILIFNGIFFEGAAISLLTPFIGSNTAFSIATGNIATDGDKYVFLFIQGLGSLGMFAFTAFVVSRLETRFVVKRLALGIKPAFKLIALAVFSMLAAQTLIQFLVELNQKIPLPDALKFLTEQGKQAEQLESALMKGSSLTMFLANAIVLAVIPAIGEELFFRGFILGELLKSKVNPVVAILTTGLLFSIAHFQYDNVLAIWVLGSFLGYLYYVSGSLWLPMVAHFTNNFLLILLKYIYNAGVIKTDIAEVDVPLYVTLVSTGLFFICFFIFTKWRRPVDFESELSDPDLINEENYSE
jgi:CAAX protease family protein